MPNTETIAVTLQKICNSFPLCFQTLAARHGLFRRPSNWRHHMARRQLRAWTRILRQRKTR
jgi:hypothetical protein